MIMTMKMPKPNIKDFTPNEMTTARKATTTCLPLTLGNRFCTFSLSIARPVINTKTPTKHPMSNGVATAPGFWASELKNTRKMKTKMTRVPTKVTRKASRTRWFCHVLPLSARVILLPCFLHAHGHGNRRTHFYARKCCLVHAWDQRNS
jgi:hypothetical protein